MCFAGTIFDNVLVSDSFEEAQEHAKQTWEKTKDGEKKMKEAQEAEAAKKEAGSKSEEADDDDHGHADDEL